LVTDSEHVLAGGQVKDLALTPLELSTIAYIEVPLNFTNELLQIIVLVLLFLIGEQFDDHLVATIYELQNDLSIKTAESVEEYCVGDIRS